MDGASAELWPLSASVDVGMPDRLVWQANKERAFECLEKV